MSEARIAANLRETLGFPGISDIARQPVRIRAGEISTTPVPETSASALLARHLSAGPRALHDARRAEHAAHHRRRSARIEGLQSSYMLRMLRSGLGTLTPFGSPRDLRPVTVLLSPHPNALQTRSKLTRIRMHRLLSL